MSAAVATPPRTTYTPARTRGVTQLNVLRSEWTKLWTLRSTRWSLLAAVLAMVALGPIIAGVQISRWTQLDQHDLATFDSIDLAVAGRNLAQLAVGVLGVLVICG